ncbi:MAG TPA: 1,2-phenylacetyl-CoA epoxidase subunit PaaD [bacterium]|jgi:ring-1,2-phenylacetyl-CoA epoxidase subunit PaaD
MPTVTIEQEIWAALESVFDPELPIAVTDLGLIDDVRVDDGHVWVKMVPTYSACPAIDVIRGDIRRRLLQVAGVTDAHVDLSFQRPWTLDRMTEHGRQRLREHGLSVAAGGGEIAKAGIACPYCGSTNAVLENPFGPTLCRAIYYCKDCRNPIERFKSPQDG